MKEERRKRNREKIEKTHKNQKNPPDELSHHDSKKNNHAGTELFGIFLRKFRISPSFKLFSRFEFDFRAPGK